MAFLKFSKNFIWGVAYSSHQVEGNNRGNDWWEWEQRGKTRDQSGQACDSWHRFREDHALAQELGSGGFRLSLEWSRIEPEEGKFDREAIEHYREVLQDLGARGMKRVVTFWHWGLPLWLVHDYGGWHKKETVDFFARYCQKVMEELGEEIDILITLNEPRIHLLKGYLIGVFPPGKRNILAYRKARKNLIEAHKKAYKICKKAKRDLPVGVTQFYNTFDYYGKVPFVNKLVEKFEDYYNLSFFKNIETHQDFIGINYYSSYQVLLWPPFLKRQGEKTTDIKWKIFPKGLYEVVLDTSRQYDKPIYIFENGLADAKDKNRAEFIHNHLAYLHKAIQEGADVRGYFHWSLLDNFEWNEGFAMRFGLVEVNFKTFQRKRRKSFYYYQKVIEENGVKT